MNYLSEYELFKKAYEYVEKNNSGNENPYHNTGHMLFVFNNAMMLFDKYKKEYNLKSNDRFIIGLSALFHDFNHSGGKLTDKENIKIAIKGIDEFLVENDIDVDKEKIHNIIEVTEFPYVYKEEDLDILKKIMLDADIFGSITDNHMDIVINLSNEWNRDLVPFLHDQINYLENLTFKLPYCNEVLKSRKDKLISNIKRTIKQLS